MATRYRVYVYIAGLNYLIGDEVSAGNGIGTGSRKNSTRNCVPDRL